MAVTYTVKGEEFIPARPSVWIDQLGGTGWDLDPSNSKRVAVVTEEEEVPRTPVHEVVMLLNFFDELRRRAPTGK
jgi:hypothetical protein